jgi:hypothetical protein
MITQNGTKTRGHTSSVSSAVREWPSPIAKGSHNPRALPRERPGRLVAQSAVRPGYDHQCAGLLGDILDGLGPSSSTLTRGSSEAVRRVPESHQRGRRQGSGGYQRAHTHRLVQRLGAWPCQPHGEGDGAIGHGQLGPALVPQIGLLHCALTVAMVMAAADPIEPRGLSKPRASSLSRTGASQGGRFGMSGP